MQYPILNEMSSSQMMTSVFSGLDRNMRIADGAMNDMQNLTSDYFPMLASRKPRTAIANLQEANGLIAKASLAYVDEKKLFYGGENLTQILKDRGVTLINCEKTMVSMGAYLIILPDKVYVNTAQPSDCGYIEAEYRSEYPATAQMCSASAGDFTYTAGDSAPQNPEAGIYWLDTSGDTDVMKVYTAEGWQSVETTYVKINCHGIGEAFDEGDAVDIHGFADGDMNGSHIIRKKTADSIVVIGILRQTVTVEAGALAVERKMPDMDFITECNNRLWGCKYGLVGGKHLNEIYCCALGDFKNWNKFDGLSTDSYTASVGTDGRWTGAITHLGYPLFFKENYMHKVFVSASGAHSIVDTACRGVMNGCEKSLAIVGEKLYYKGRDGIYVYDGALPVSVGAPLGMERFSDAAAAEYGQKYYISMRGKDSGWSLFVFDTEKGIWIREDNIHARYMVRHGDGLFCIAEGTGDLLDLTGNTDGTEEGAVPWSFTTGIIGYNDSNAKYVSRFQIRASLADGQAARLDIEYDSSGVWYNCGNIIGNGIKSDLLPINPRRCDHFRLRMCGKGDFKLFSITKEYRRGSDKHGH